MLDSRHLDRRRNPQEKSRDQHTRNENEGDRRQQKTVRNGNIKNGEVVANVQGVPGLATGSGVRDVGRRCQRCNQENVAR
jgi:hypothetical protein